MQTSPNAAPAEPVSAPIDGLRLLIEPEPWFRVFLHNLGYLFRPNPPKVWMTAIPADYWADAQVHRPVAWTRMLQSYLGHAVVLTCIYAANLYWLNQPHVISEEPPTMSTVLRYPISEYLPELKPQAEQNEVPLRQLAQKADPEYSAQRIVSLNVDHTSRRQTVIQPDIRLLQQDVPMPNVVTWTPLPIAPVATHRQALTLPAGAPEVAPPAQPTVDSSVSRLTFPVPPQPQVIAPSSPVATNPSATRIIAMPGPLVIPPTEETAARDPSRLQLTAQAPQVAAPSQVAVARTNFAVLTPIGQPDVVPAPSAAAKHSTAAMALPEAGPAVVPPAQPIAGGTGRTQQQEMGRLLSLNVQPLPPSAPVTVPEGSRKGEFAAGPDGRNGASGNPETKKGTPSSANTSRPGNGPAGVYVDSPPGTASGERAAAGTRMPPAMLKSDSGHSSSAEAPPTDRIDNEIFGSRRRYSMHLNMPNLNSAMGSWTVRFAELNADPAERGDLTAPEAIRKVDPAYPANLIREQIEGVVVLHAVIHSDGSVGDVRILEGFYEELDENARAALEQWRFRPGTKNGVPVDVEAVIRVPFRVRKLGF